ncbi:MAG: hypothetical protein QNL33_02270 [Akkermansiaceae bacterium]|jgi:hypothetical protein
MNKKLKFTLLALVGGIAFSNLTSCVPLAAGAAGGYLLKEEGYKVQSPITKD